MKKMLLVVLALSLRGIAWSNDAVGYAQLFTDKVKETVPAMLLNMDAKPAVSAFLPVWTFHDAAGIDYVQTGIMGKWQQGEQASAQIVPFTINLVGLSGRIWGFEWASSHVKRSKFPDIFAGPAFGCRLDGNIIHNIQDWRIKDNLYLMTYVRFGSGS